MKKSKKSVLIFIYCLVFLCLSVSLWLQAQEPDIEQVNAIIQKSDLLIQQQQWEKAADLLMRILESYRVNASTEKIRGLLFSQLGMLYQKKATLNRETRTDDLSHAVRYYHEAQKLQPHNKEIVEHLAQIFSLRGEPDHAISWYRESIKLEPDKKKQANYFVAIGDIQAKTGNMENALDTYKKGAELDPHHKTVNWKILRVYRNLGHKSLPELNSFCEHMKANNKKEYAKYGYELIMGLTVDSNTQEAENALFEWARLCTQQGGISRSGLDSLPEQVKWSSSAYSELRDLVNNPEVNAYYLDWWNSSEQKKNVAAAVLQGVAAERTANQELRTAAHILEVAFALAPDYRAYDDPELRPVMPTLIALDLASLYARFPEMLDPKGRKMEQLEERLFDQKSWGYAEKNYESIFRLHSVLGMIYAARNQWTPEEKPTSGIYQLKNAIKVAGELRKKDIKNDRPLPNLHRLLAKGYKEINNSEQAYRNYLGAAVGYLDIDNLNETERMMKNAVAIQERRGMDSSPDMDRIMQIWTYRKQISGLKPEDIQNASFNYGRIKKYLDKVALNKNEINPFLRRQFFKLLSDFGSKAKQAHNLNDEITYHMNALEIIAKEKILTSMEDYIRLEKIENTITTYVRIEGKAKVIDLRSHQELKKPAGSHQGWWLPSSSDSPPYQILTDKDLILAGRIANQKIMKPQLFVDIPEISIKDGSVTLHQAQGSMQNIQHTIEALKYIPGILEVDYDKKASFLGSETRIEKKTQTPPSQSYLFASVRKGLYSEALMGFSERYNKFRDSKDAYGLALCYRGLKNDEKAKEWARNSLENNRVDHLLSREEIEILDDIILPFPSREFLFDLVKRGELQQALKGFFERYKKHPNSKDAYGLFLCHLRLKNQKGAEEYAKLAIRYNQYGQRLTNDEIQTCKKILEKLRRQMTGWI